MHALVVPSAAVRRRKHPSGRRLRAFWAEQEVREEEEEEEGIEGSVRPKERGWSIAGRERGDDAVSDMARAREARVMPGPLCPCVAISPGPGR